MKTNIIIHKSKTSNTGKRLQIRKMNKHNLNYNLIKAVNAKKLYQFGTPVKIICNDLNISKTTLYCYLKYEELDYKSYIRHSSKIESIEN